MSTKKVQAAIDELAALKVQLGNLEAEYKSKQEALIGWLDKAGLTEVSSESWSAQRIQSKRLAVDLGALSQVVDAAVIDQVTKRSVDTTAFRNAVARGVISTETAKLVTSETETAPFLKFTPKR